MPRRVVATLLISLFTITSALAGCFADDDDGGGTLLADFSYDPSANIKVSDSVSFNASVSLPQDGTLTYRWDFNGDGSVDSGGITPVTTSTSTASSSTTTSSSTSTN